MAIFVEPLNDYILSSQYRFLARTAQHPVLQRDSDFRDFLERDGDLPKATSTSALSGAGMRRLFHKVGDAVDKISYKMDEADEVRYIAHTRTCITQFSGSCTPGSFYYLACLVES